MLEKIIQLLLFISYVRSAHSKEVDLIATSEDFFNNRRNVHDIAVRNDSDTFYVLVDNLFNPSLQTFDGDSGGIKIPSNTPISFYCAVCVKKKSLSNIDIRKYSINMKLDKYHKEIYKNHLTINTDKYQCLADLFSISDGLQYNERQYLTCTIYNIFNDTYRYIYNYIDIEDRDNVTFKYFDMFKVPKGTNYLTCKKINKKDKKGQIFFWGRLVEHEPMFEPNCREIVTNDRDFPEKRVSKEIAKYKIMPILENGAHLSIINQVQVTNIDDYTYSDKIMCMNYKYLTKGNKEPNNVRIVVWYLEKNAPNIISVPILVNSSCIYPFVMYSIRNPSRLVDVIKYQSSTSETIELKDILTITGYCIIVFLCILIIVCIIIYRDTLCLCTFDRRYNSRRQNSTYKQDFESVLNKETYDDSIGIL